MARKYRKTLRWWKSWEPRLKNKNKLYYARRRIKILETQNKALKQELKLKGYEEKQINKITQQIEKGYRKKQLLAEIKTLKTEETIKERAQQQQKQKKRFEQKVAKQKPMTEYLRKQHISTINTNIARIRENEKSVYKELLYQALLRPKQYTDLIIENIASIKQHIETELGFIEYTKDGTKNIANMTITGKTLAELKTSLDELGITQGTILESNKLKEISERLGAKNAHMSEGGKHTIGNINVTIRLIRGRI